MTLDDSVHGLRLHAIQRAQAVGNVSAVCRELGISRTLFYRWRRRWERYGADGVHPRRQSAGPGRPIQVAPEVERVVLGLAISTATWGCGRLAAYLTRRWQIRLAPSTVQRVLRRAGLATRRARLTIHEFGAEDSSEMDDRGLAGRDGRGCRPPLARANGRIDDYRRALPE